MCSAGITPLLQLYPWIHVLPVEEQQLVHSGKVASAFAIAALWRRLFRRGPYDLCATLYFDSRYRLLTLPIRARHKIFLSHMDRGTRLLPGRRYADEYARILTRRTDAETPNQLAPVPLPAHSMNKISAANADIPPVSERPRVVLVPAGARNLLRDDALRRWPVERYVQLAAPLLDRGFEVVLLGGPGDAWASPLFASLQTLDRIGKLSLVESIALLDSADVTVTHDTGPLHMAGMTRTSIVALFGPTSPYNFCPQRENVIALWGGNGFACRPCYDGRDLAPCPNNGCLQQITPSLVLEAIDRLLQAAREGRRLPPVVEVPPHTALVWPGTSS